MQNCPEPNFIYYVFLSTSLFPLAHSVQLDSGLGAVLIRSVHCGPALLSSPVAIIRSQSRQWAALTLDTAVMFYLPMCIISQSRPFAAHAL